MKSIPGYEGFYSAEENGRIWSDRTKKYLKPFANNRGYMICILCVNYIKKTCLIHRLIALTFIPNPENKSTVDHIDRNNKNNNISNLRWATPEEQLENTNERPKFVNNSQIGKSGEKYIHYCPNLEKWRVYNRRHNKCLEYFKTLEEAIAYRDEYLLTC